MKQVETNTLKAGGAKDQSAKNVILRSLLKISAVLKPKTEDLNFSRWQELEYRNNSPQDRFEQHLDRRFK